MLRIGLESEPVVLVVIYVSEYHVDPAALLGYYSISNCALYILIRLGRAWTKEVYMSFAK
jgi:hypothetical protein